MGSTLSQTQPQKTNGCNQQFLSVSDIWADFDKQNNKISHLKTQQNMLQSSRTRSQSLYSNSINFVAINKNAKKLPHQRNMKPGLSCTISQNKISKNKYKQNKQPCVNTIKNNNYMMRRLILNPDNQNLINEYLSNCGIDQGKIYVKSKSNSIKNINKEKVICKLIGFQRQYQRYYCGSHTAVKMVFQQVGSYTLQQQLQIRASQLLAKTQRLFHEQTASILMDYSFKLSQITKITKFLLDVAEQLLPKESRVLHQNLIPKISLADIILQNCETQTVPRLKYRHPIQSIFFQNRQLTRKYIKQQQQQSFTINELDYSEMQSNILVNIGVCLMSICLLQDCYQSCFNSLGQVCISAIEKKIEEICELYQKNFETKLVKLMCDMIHEFIFQGIGQLPRLTFLQAKSKLTKISIKHQQQIIKSLSPISNECFNVQSTLSDVCTILNDTFKHNIKKPQLYIQNLNIQVGANFFKKQRHSQPKNICLESFRKNRNSNNISINLNLRQKNGSKDLISSAKAPKSHPIEWVIDHSSQRKILKVNNSLMPRTNQWLIAEQKQKKNLKNYDYESQYEKIDQKWSEDEELFKNMPDLWNNQKNFIEKQNQFEDMCVSNINFTYK